MLKRYFEQRYGTVEDIKIFYDKPIIIFKEGQLGVAQLKRCFKARRAMQRR